MLTENDPGAYQDWNIDVNPGDDDDYNNIDGDDDDGDDDDDE